MDIKIEHDNDYINRKYNGEYRAIYKKENGENENKDEYIIKVSCTIENNTASFQITGEKNEEVVYTEHKEYPYEQGYVKDPEFSKFTPDEKTRNLLTKDKLQDHFREIFESL